MVKQINQSKAPPWQKPPRYLFRKLNLISQLKKLEGCKTFVDIGCGAGDLACTLVAELDMQGKGFDFADNAIETANKLKSHYGLSGQPEFVLTKGSLPKGLSADLVLCMEVMEHVKDDATLLKQLVDFSKRYVVISVPAKQRLFSYSDKVAGHFRRYEKQDLIRLLEENGLEIMEFIAYGYPFTNWIRIIREQFSKKSSTNMDTPSGMEAGTKKSGVDLFNVNQLYGRNLETLIKPFYFLSTLFNHTNLSEGYLVICKKQS